MKQETPIRDQYKFTAAVVWTLARIAQEIINRVTWPWKGEDKYFADKVLKEYKDMIRKEDN